MVTSILNFHCCQLILTTLLLLLNPHKQKNHKGIDTREMVYKYNRPTMC